MAEHSRARLATADDSGILARDAYTCLHLPIVAGIIMVAVGDDLLIAQPRASLDTAGIVMTEGGPALYPLGESMFRLRMIGSVNPKRLMAVVALCALGLVAGALSALALAGAVGCAADRARRVGVRAVAGAGAAHCTEGLRPGSTCEDGSRRLGHNPGVPRATAFAVSLLACASLLGCGGSQTATTSQSASRPATARPPTTPASSTTTAGAGQPAPVARQVPPRPRVHRPSPGSLPQTDRLPTAATAEFRARMDGLWQAIATGSLDPALPALFPEGAYAQLKAIGDPRGDFVNRLEAEYRVDLLAAHALLGDHAATTRLVRVIVPSDYAHWVPPGVCYNDVGYYETPNSRLVYSEDGQSRSIGIASMISWRGVWYVIHLGAILRSGYGGEVDDPEPGTGTPAPSGTC